MAGPFPKVLNDANAGSPDHASVQQQYDPGSDISVVVVIAASFHWEVCALHVQTVGARRGGGDGVAANGRGTAAPLIRRSARLPPVTMPMLEMDFSQTRNRNKNRRRVLDGLRGTGQNGGWVTRATLNNTAN